MPKPPETIARIVIVGAGGHARVLLDSVRAAGHSQVLGFCDAHSELHGLNLHGVPVIGDDEALLRMYQPDAVMLVNGLGSVGDCARRMQVFERFKVYGYKFANVIHPTAYIASEVKLGEGVQIMAGALVQTSASLGDNVLLNSQALVEHNCRISNHVHIASGAVVAGLVHIGQASHIGCGATVIQGISIGPRVLVAAGAVVVKDVARDSTVMGVPARVTQVRGDD